jgi:hypothetical protein
VLFLTLLSPVVVLGLLLVMQVFEGHMFGSESASQGPEVGHWREAAEARKLRSAASGSTDWTRR